jgi:hypothetical protein
MQQWLLMWRQCCSSWDCARVLGVLWVMTSLPLTSASLREIHHARYVCQPMTGAGSWAGKAALHPCHCFKVAAFIH